MIEWWLSVARTQFIQCKTFGHAWEPFTPLKKWFALYKKYAHYIHLRCVRCGCTRHDGLNIYGDVVYREYRHPDGYKDAKDEKPTRAELRLIVAGGRRQRKAS